MPSDLLTDLRYSARSLTRTPVWTLTLVLTIALGTGSTASVQGFVRGLMTTDLPISAIQNVATVFAVDPEGRSGPVSFETFTALQERRDIFQSLGAIRESQKRVSMGRRSLLMSVAAYTPEVGDVFPIAARQGVTLSHRVRFAQFAATVDPAGTALRLGTVDTLIAGAMPYWLEGLYRGRAVDLWAPLAEAGPLTEGSRFWLIGRLNPGVSASQAQAMIDNRTWPGTEAIAVLSYTGQTPEAAGGMRRVGSLLQLAATAVFMIACANVAAFMLTRASARARETAVRVAIGAKRRQLIRQLLIDSALISVMGGAAGVILASWIADIVPLMFFDQDAERLVFAPDASGIVLTSLLCIAITIGFGLMPLLETRDDRPSAVLQREASGPSKAASRISRGLIVVQMAACTLLVISTGLLLQSFRASLETAAGRHLGNPVLATLEALPASRSATLIEGRKYFDDAVMAARSVEPVADLVWAARLPGARVVWQWARFDPPPSTRRDVTLELAPLTQTAMENIDLPPSSGRLFGTYDAGTCGTIVVNEAAAAALFEGHPVGRVIEAPGGLPVEVIGVVRQAARPERSRRDERAVARPAAYRHPEATVPIGRPGETTFRAPPRADLDSGLIDVNIVSANYFDAMGMTLVAGELFDADRRGCRIGVLNEEAAARFFDGHAIGGAVIDANGVRTEIVGVVRSALLRTEQRLAEPALFVPMTQDLLPRMTALLSIASTNRSTLEAIRQRIAQVPGGRPDRMVITTLGSHLSRTAYAPERIATVLVAAFTAIALVLGGLGLYGVMADSARSRRREFAVRLALGAQGWRVVRQLMGEGMWLAGAGAITGMIACVLIARWLTSIAPGAGWPSPSIWIAAPLLLAAAVTVASAIPARRALSVDLLSLMRDM
jgi:ABC-type lipoprotein release transport system permease subunit